MALAAATTWEVRTAGSDTNGGGFVTGATGTDYSLQDSKNTVGNNISTTDAVANGTTTITSATGAFTSAIVGNIVYLSGGTGSIAAQWRQVTGFTNATTITIDATIAASTGMTMNIGGALLSVGQAAASATAGNTIYVKAGTYTISSASTNVTGGCVNLNGGQQFVGYSTTRTLTNTDTKPILQYGVISTATLWATAPNLYNLAMDGTNQTAARAMNGGNAVRCTFKNFNTANTTANFFYCYATTCSAAMFTQISIFCEATACTATPFLLTGSEFAYGCLSYANTGASTDGFSFAAGAYAANCVAYSNGRDGFRSTNGNNQAIVALTNCIAESNIGVGFNASSSGRLWTFNCATFGNGSTTAGTLVSVSQIANSTGTFFVNAAGGNFALNSVTLTGFLARAGGYVGAFPVAPTTSYLDIGAVQHQDPPVIFRKNSALAGFGFPMFDTSGNLKTGLTITSQRVLDGGAIATMANSVSEISAGAYKIDLAAADVNANTGNFLFTAPGAASAAFSFITQTFTKNQALNGFSFPMRSATTGSLLTGLTVTAQMVLDGGAVTTMANAVTEVSFGIYAINLAAADVNCNSGLFLFTAAGCVPTVFTFVTQA
jgi:hypothetical protein